MSPNEFHANLKAKGRGKKDWANSWSEIEYLGVDEQGRDKFAASINVGHQVFKDKTDGQWKKHKLTDERPLKDYVLLQSAKCCVEVYPYYAKIFDVDHEEVRLHEERWVVQRLFQEPDTWRDVDAYNPVITIEEAEDSITVTITYDSDYGSLVVKYIQRDGFPLKHEVIFTNTSDGTETFRVLQRWAGIVGAKCNHRAIPHTIETVDEAAGIKFQREDGNFTIGENLWNMIFEAIRPDPLDSPDRTEKTDQRLQLPISIESHAQGMKTDFIYGFWTLEQNNFLVIDPDTYSNDNPTEDGDIKSTGVREETSSVLIVRYNSSTGVKIRGYADWNVSGIPDSAEITYTGMQYHCYDHDSDCHIHQRTSPYTVSNAALYADCGDDTTYTNPPGLFIEGVNEVELGTSANADLEAQLGSNWFAIGMQKDSETSGNRCRLYAEEGSASASILKVTYTPGIVIPTVSTQVATNVQATTATGNGNITSTGGENCDFRGVEWGTSPGSYPNSLTDSGSFPAGAFTKGMTSLPTGDVIYYRAKAHNSAGWGYGGQSSFLTKPAAPTGVSATDGTHSDKVVITWTKSAGATQYQVYRNSTPLGWLGDVATHNDTGAGAPTITPGTTVASDGSSTAHVSLSLSGTGTNNGSTHTYKLRAKNATGESSDSGTNTGYRAPGSLLYQWQRSAADSDASYGNISGATSSTHNDTGAPAPTITHGSCTASDGTYNTYVRLVNNGASANIGAGRYFRCQLNASGCSQVYSGSNRGYRGVGSLTYQWYKSAGDSNASYSTISGATSSTYNYTGAPAPTITKGSVTATDGDYTDKVTLDASGYSTSNGAGRYYKCRHTATGASSGYTGANRGYRSPGSLNRQWQVSAVDSDADYSNITGATSDPYDYTEAPAPTITSGTASASDGTYAAHVALSLSGQSANVGAGRYYRARYTASGCTIQYTSGNRGYIGVGTLTYQWQRSSGDSDTDYSNIIGATTASYNDTGAPANGDGRWYQCVEDAIGATQQTSTSDRGYRITWCTVTTQDATDLDIGQGRLNGNITATGGENADERGFDWDYNAGEPYSYDETDLGDFGTGAFNELLTGLTQSETVYFRGKAHNSAGWGYGSEKNFRVPKAWSETPIETLAVDDVYRRAFTGYRTLLQPSTITGTLSLIWSSCRVFKDSITIHDSILTRADKVLSRLEALSISDIVAGGLHIGRNVIEYLTITTTGLYLEHVARRSIEGLTISAMVSRAADMYRSVSETLTVSDIRQVIVSYIRKPIDSLILSGTVSRLSQSLVNLIQAMTINDISAKVWSMYRPFFEGLTISDTRESIASYIRASIESLNISSFIEPFRSTFINVMEAITLSDYLATVRTWIRSSIENLQLHSAFIRTGDVTQWISQSMSISDIYARRWTAYTTYLEAPEISDMVSTITSKIRRVFESLSISDIQYYISSTFRSFVDSMTITDFISSSANTVRLYLEHLAISDKIAKTFSMVRRASMDINSIFISRADYLRSFYENTTISDMTSNIEAYVRAFLDSIQIQDILIPTTNYYRVFTDGLTIASDVVKKWGRFLTEAFTITGYYVKNFSYHLVQTMQIGDFVNKPSDSIRSMIEGLEITDSFSRVWDATMSLIQPMTIVDSISSIWARLLRYTYTEAMEISGIIDKHWTKSYRFLESIDISDTFSRASGWVRQYTQGMSIVAFGSVPLSVARRLIQSMQIDSLITKIWTYPTVELYELLTMSDILRQPSIRAISDFLSLIVVDAGQRASDVVGGAKRASDIISRSERISDIAGGAKRIVYLIKRGIRKVKVLEHNDV